MAKTPAIATIVKVAAVTAAVTATTVSVTGDRSSNSAKRYSDCNKQTTISATAQLAVLSFTTSNLSHHSLQTPRHLSGLHPC